ncbi:hypothetical protein BH09PSE3_BH09PSE3_13980 [soil metagenome]
MASIYRRFATGTFLIAIAAPAQSQNGPWQNLDAVDAVIVASVGGGGVPRAVDRRIKLAKCPDVPVVGAVIGGSVAVVCNALGWRIRVPVTVSSVTSTTPVLMRKGDPVSVLTGAAGFSASISGIADGEGRLGDRVRVKTGPGRGVIVGQVVDAGTVRIY